MRVPSYVRLVLSIAASSAIASSSTQNSFAEIDRRSPLAPSNGTHLSDYTKTMLKQAELGMDAIYSGGLIYPDEGATLATKYREWISDRMPYATKVVSTYDPFDWMMQSFDYTLKGPSIYAEGFASRQDARGGVPLSSDTPDEVRQEMAFVAGNVTNRAELSLHNFDIYSKDTGSWGNMAMAMAEPFMHAFAIKIASLYQTRIYQTMLHSPANDMTDAIASTNSSIKTTATQAKQWFSDAPTLVYDLVHEHETRLRHTTYTTARICGSRVIVWHVDTTVIPSIDTWDTDVYTAHCSYKRCKTDGCHDQLNTPEQLATWAAEDIAHERVEIMVIQEIMWGNEWAKEEGGIASELDRIIADLS